MKWTYLLYLPVVVSVFWSVLILATKKHPTRAQIILSIQMLLLAFASAILIVIYRGRTDNLFIYEYIFELVAILCGPLYYIGICALTEARGSTLRQRRILLIPFLFILALTVGSFLIGPKQYNLLCHQFRFSSVAFQPGNPAWNFMHIWSHHVFLILLLILNPLILFVASRKNIIFQKRFNSYYADGIGAPKLHSRILVAISWLFFPVVALVVSAVLFRPLFAKYVLLVAFALLAILLHFTGRYIYRLDYDARYLAQFIKNKNLQS